MDADFFAINPDIVLRSEEEGAFLFEPDSGRICLVNEVGRSIWKLCKNPVTLSEIIVRITHDYADVPHEKVHAECREFLSNLEKLGFLSIAH